MTDDQRALTSERLALEPILPGHADVLFAGLSDPALYTFLPDDPPASVEALRARFARQAGRWSPDQTQRWLNWALRHDGAAVGLVQATVTSERALIAYMLFTGATGRGLASEAVARVVRHLFDDLAVTDVIAEIDTRNTRSVALITRLGFRPVAVAAAADHFKGSVSDEVHYGLTRPGAPQDPRTTFRGP